MKTSSTVRQTLTMGATLGALLFAGSVLAVAFVTADPPVAPPTGQVTVKGAHFPPNSPVEVFLKAKHCALNTNAQGRFSCTFKVPRDLAPGAQKIWTVARNSGEWVKTPFTVRTDWGNEAFDGGRTRYNPYENRLNRWNVSRLQRLWSAPGTLQLVAGGRVFIKPTAFDGIQALNEANGQEVWRRATQPGEKGARPLAAANGKLYADLSRIKAPGAYGDSYSLGIVAALRTDNGTPQWTVERECDYEYQCGFTLSAAIPRAGGDRAFLFFRGSTWSPPRDYFEELRILAVRASNGVLVWEGGGDGWSYGAPDGENAVDFLPGVVANGSVSWEMDRYDFYSGIIHSRSWSDNVLNAANGTPLRSRSRECSYDEVTGAESVCSGVPNAEAEPVVSSAAVADNGLTLYNTSPFGFWENRSSGPIERASDGQLLGSWKAVGANENPVGSPALAAGIIYAGASVGGQPVLYAVRALDGKRLWQRAVTANVGIQPTVANGVVYLGRSAYDVRNGDWLWTNPALVDTVSPIVVNGRLYANQTDGKMSAWGLQ